MTAARVTVVVSLGGVALALLIGLLVAVIRLWRVPVLSVVAGAYVEFSRNTPSLVQLFFLYFGLPKLGILLSQEACAIACLAFLGGGYMAEAFRSALEAVPVVQHESAQVLGLSSRQALQHVILPQAMAQATPALVANVIFLVKESSVVSGIALADLMYVAKDIIGQSYDTAEALFLLVVSYAVILVPLSVLGTYVERRFADGC
ncbi:amino acid ABC transporter permease [Olsenella intestinalis]|uniref:amino acid ABC transporter permease n=1 Tax=Olsenella intestinalis TaxID=2930083 RepID=UPI00200F365E|nr:amino acid ABC transporter permease [Olsenella intestinalis]